MEAEEGRVSRLVFPSDCDRTSVVAARVAIGVITTRSLAFSTCEIFQTLINSHYCIVPVEIIPFNWKWIAIDAQVIERF